MKKYMNALRDVSWPKGKEVSSNLGIVLFGILAFTLFFLAMDTSISKILEILYA